MPVSTPHTPARVARADERPPAPAATDVIGDRDPRPTPPVLEEFPPGFDDFVAARRRALARLRPGAIPIP